MTRAFLDPCFTQHERRLCGYMEAALWLTGTTLVLALMAWSLNLA